MAGCRKLGVSTMLIHLGIMLFGLAAFFTGPMADDYKRMDYSGYTVHAWFGMALTVFVMVRLFTGLVGPVADRFYSWVPIGERFRQVVDDVSGLFRFRLPEREPRCGIAGLVQAIGLFGFFFMALTGSWLYLILEPGKKSVGLAHDIKEMHEVGMLIVLPFLLMHAGAVLLHAFKGKHYWKQAFLIEESKPVDSGNTEKP